jgi:hypothetical protein
VKPNSTEIRPCQGCGRGVFFAMVTLHAPRRRRVRFAFDPEPHPLGTVAAHPSGPGSWQGRFVTAAGDGDAAAHPLERRFRASTGHARSGRRGGVQETLPVQASPAAAGNVVPLDVARRRRRLRGARGGG